MEELEQLGLTKNEATIYVFLLKNGSITTGPIIKETGIANSRVYESLNSLISKGFVHYHMQKDGKYFEATDPEILREKEQERQKKVESLLPNLLSMKSINESKAVTVIYEGYDGFKTAFAKIIEDCPKGEEINILGFSEQQYASKTLRTFLANMNLKSAQKKQKLRIILDQSARDTQGKERSQEKFTQVRYMPKGYISPAAIDIFEDCVYIFLWEEKPYVFMMKNKAIAESFKQYFNFLWRIAQK